MNYPTRANQQAVPATNYGRVRSMVAGACAVFLLTSCGSATPSVLQGRATSMLFNPERVGGLPVGQGPSGPRPDAPRPTGTVENTDNGPIDELALLAVNDIQEFWQQNYAKYFPGSFAPVDTLLSYDSTDPDGPLVCGNDLYGLPNAVFCYLDNVMAWDRGVFVPVGREYFGDMGVVGIIAHDTAMRCRTCPS